MSERPDKAERKSRLSALAWPAILISFSMGTLASFLPSEELLAAGGVKYVYLVLVVLIVVGFFIWREHLRAPTGPAGVLMAIATIMWIGVIAMFSWAMLSHYFGGS